MPRIGAASCSQSAPAPLKQRRVNAVYARSLDTEFNKARIWIIGHFGHAAFDNAAEADTQLEAYVQHFYEGCAVPSERPKFHGFARDAVLGAQHRHRNLQGGL